MIEIRNDKLIVEISNKACEVTSFRKVNEDYSYTWNGNEKYWKGRNPILFPQVSSSDNKTTLINGTYYPMGNHGFARNSVFEIESVKEDEVTFYLTENEETLKQYPFKFKLTVNYKLDNERLLISYIIKNNDEKDMPYGFGLHPAFNCLDDYKDTKVVFDKSEETFGKEIVISKELFEKYPTVIIENPKSSIATLVSGDRKIAISFEGFPIFAIWSMGPFVCLEPWFNLTDKDHTIEMKDRKGFKVLKPNEEFRISYSWFTQD